MRPPRDPLATATRAIVALLCLALGVSLAACRGKDRSTAAAASSAQQASAKKWDDEFRRRDEEAAERADAGATVEAAADSEELRRAREVLARLVDDPDALHREKDGGYRVTSVGVVKRLSTTVLLVPSPPGDRAVAPPGALRSAPRPAGISRDGAWARITDGPLKGSFIRRHGAAAQIEVWPEVAVCFPAPPRGTELGNECGR